MTRWNPHDPATLGLEFLGHHGSSRVASLAQPVYQRFRSNAAETIAGVRVHLGVTDVGTRSMLLAEVVTAGQEFPDPDGYVTILRPPNHLAVLAGSVTSRTTVPPATGAASVTSIDEWAAATIFDPFPTTDYNDFIAIGPGASMALQFTTAADTPTGRVAAVAVELLTNWGTPGVSSATDSARRAVVSLLSGGVSYGTQTRIVPNNNTAGTSGRLLVSWGEINPITNQPWTAADVQSFDTASLEVKIDRQTGDTGALQIAAARLVVVYEPTERRQARGVYLTTGAARAAWTSSIALARPDGTANWPKANASDYSLVLRQADRGGLTGFGSDFMYLSTVHAVDGESVPSALASSVGSSVTVTHLADNNVTLATLSPTEADTIAGQMVAFVLRTTGPATSADGQPYSTVELVDLKTGAGSQQEFRTSSSDDYAELRVAIGYAATFPDEDVTVTVRRRSDSASMGVLTITPDDLTLAGGTEPEDLVVVAVKAPAPFALASGVQYYLDFTTAADTDHRWLLGLPAVQGGAGGITYQEATYQGGTDEASPIAGLAATVLSFTPGDFSALLGASVDPPTNLTVTAEHQAVDEPASDCSPQSIPFLEVSWDATVMGTDFAAYRLQRLSPAGVWQDVAVSVDESQTTFQDLEARLGVEECYRVRAERIDGSTSYWPDDPTCGTIVADGCGYYFTTNQDPDASVAYADTGDQRTPERGYEFPEASEVVYRAMYRRDFQVAFRPTSRRGVTFTRRLLITAWQASPPVGFGPGDLEALRDIAVEAVPYVCVRDELGNRWYGTITIPDGTTRADAGIAWATLTFTETTDTPAPATPEPGPAPVGDFTFIGGDTFELVAAAGPLSLV